MQRKKETFYMGGMGFSSHNLVLIKMIGLLIPVYWKIDLCYYQTIVLKTLIIITSCQKRPAFFRGKRLGGP